MSLYQVWCEGPHGFRSRIGEPQSREDAERFVYGDALRGVPHTHATNRPGETLAIVYRLHVLPVGEDRNR